MAHECPECYQVCYCGRDIDDLLLNAAYDVIHCAHCPIDGTPDDDEYEDDDNG